MAVEPKDSRYGPHRVPIPTDDDTVPASRTDEPPPPTAAAPPTLSMLWGQTPVITSELPKSDGAGGDKEKKVEKAPTHAAFNVNVGGLADSMDFLRSSSTEMVAQYEALKTLVLQVDAAHTVFGEQATYKDTIPKARPNPSIDKRHGHEFAPSDPDPGPLIKPDEGVRAAAGKFGPMMYPGMKNVLMECANAIELVGRYMVLMGRTGSYYAHADHQSAFPEPTGKSITD